MTQRLVENTLQTLAQIRLWTSFESSPVSVNSENRSNILSLSLSLYFRV